MAYKNNDDQQAEKYFKEAVECAKSINPKLRGWIVWKLIQKRRVTNVHLATSPNLFFSYNPIVKFNRRASNLQIKRLLILMVISNFHIIVGELL